jgi:hypothetical protein
LQHEIDRKNEADTARNPYFMGFALPERRVTVHSGDMGYTIGPFARRAKCPGRSVIPWMNG